MDTINKTPPESFWVRLKAASVRTLKFRSHLFGVRSLRKGRDLSIKIYNISLKGYFTG